MAEAEQIAPELVGRMVKLVRAIRGSGSLYYAHEVAHLYEEACAISVKLPKPVDPDLVEARSIAKPWLIYDQGGVDSGLCDRQPALVAILAAIKRGRELEAGNAR